MVHHVAQVWKQETDEVLSVKDCATGTAAARIRKEVGFENLIFSSFCESAGFFFFPSVVGPGEWTKLAWILLHGCQPVPLCVQCNTVKS